ncbi:MAG: hypothetical protein IPK81_01475 [Rhodospirillales bacterium]|nr:hypothetical protein [Rhodospirillales bacterium]QQS12973.1 MAG: hypothetical protein IPK81_01475 [Rhodospirillales bacterium]
MRRPSIATALSGLCAAAALSACASNYTWERSGASSETMRADYADCRKQAGQEAFREFAFNRGFITMGPGYWGYPGRPEYWMWQQRLQSDRFYYENRLTHFCMRNKGYELVQVEQDMRAVPPAAPAPAR